MTSKNRLGGIYNLSNVTLTHKETNILHLGLKCGFKKPISKFNVYVDVHKYMCKLRIKKYLKKKNSSPVSLGGSSSVAVDNGLRNNCLIHRILPHNILKCLKA